ncbi:MAG: c-type cytochrome [Chitinophagaceae bacterium]|nr:MAG: c-type cytochrome [Chitinophagaceae bacterium]
MKSVLLVLSAVVLITACSSNGSGANDAAIHRAGSESRGGQLIAQSDCLTCHKNDEPLVGPSYKSVAERYTGKPDAVLLLAGKILKGGSGNWGQTPMTPHTDLSQEDAEAMVEYILSVK